MVSVEPLRLRSGPLELEAALHLPARVPAPGVVVCHPHPLYGGDMSNGVVSELCRVLSEDGIAVLRFNFRGVGASEGAYDHGRGEQDDARAALAVLAGRDEVDAARLGLAGYSFGAMVALEVARGAPGLRGLALVSPPVGAAGNLTLPAGMPVVVVCGDTDQFAPVRTLEALAEAGAGVRLEIVRGADHFWWSGGQRLLEAVRAFFTDRFATSGSPGSRHS